ncbi:hypothetical protein BDP27DRAFT_1310540 [Rhodocollybia butyracea]|uniref:Uncharacterized protein n=1 Tax=Rhodocollybia butyracea TaxID=206335 RepID=A0A9P5UG49_9AGAR|nr:hypothetical protein BDP27DRAFT_1310540 [Rhodocollybia butyracea]
MVVKKQNVAPPMGSRTNSSQPLPRAKVTSNSKQPLPAGPTKKTKQKQKPPKSKKTSSTIDRLVLSLLAIFTIYALSTCPTDTQLSNPLCRSLSQYRTHILEPYVLPPIQKALAHPSVAPAVDKFHSVERAVTPAVTRAHSIAQPYITRATQFTQRAAVTGYEKAFVPVYNRHIQPSYRKYILPQYKRYVLPLIEPYLTPLTLQAHLYANKALWLTHRMYLTIVPRAQIAYNRAAPFAERTWASVRPHAIKATEVGTRLLAMTLEQSVMARRQFVDPHVIRIWAKVIELSGSSTASSTTFVAASSFAETKAVSSEGEPETIQSSLSPTVYIATTILSEVPEAPSEDVTVPEESSLPAPTSLEDEAISLDTDATSASLSELPTFTPYMDAETPSVSSTAAETIPTPKLEEIDAENSPQTNSDVETEIELEVISISEPEPVQEEEPEPEVGIDAEAPPQPTSDVETEIELDPEFTSSSETEFMLDLEDFFADLGLLEDDEEEAEEGLAIEDEETTSVTSLTSEESAEARRVATAKKRERLEAQMEKSHLDLDALIKRCTKAFRKELVRIRKGAVRSLFPDPEKDNSDLEEALTHIRGEDVAGVLGRFEKETEKLLKGLETYLKKEEKVVADSDTVDVDDHMKRWYTVVQRVEERFVERLRELEEKIHWWYLEVRELEVQEYHRTTTEVKTFAQKAQGDIGMPMAWLDDVTYQDWQRYHDLMRAHGHFDEQIRMIQNGSHPSPPIDPLVPALDKLQLELDEIKSGFNARVRTLGTQIHDVLVLPSLPEEHAPEEAEDEVSILPIDPVETSPVGKHDEAVDMSNIILGKSKEQVEEAMSIAQEPLREEL